MHLSYRPVAHLQLFKLFVFVFSGCHGVEGQIDRNQAWAARAAAGLCAASDGPGVQSEPKSPGAPAAPPPEGADEAAEDVFLR